MKLYFLTLVCLLAIHTSASAQAFNYGIEGGLTTSRILLLFSTEIPTEPGYTVGAFAKWYPEDNKFIGVGLSLRYNSMQSATASSTQTSNRLVRLESSFSHKESYLRIALSGEMKVIKKPFPVYFSVGLSGNGVLQYQERRISSRIITDGSSPPSVQESFVDQEFYFFLGPHTGVQAKFKNFGIGVDLSVFYMDWKNLARMRTTRFAFLASYTFGS